MVVEGMGVWGMAGRISPLALLPDDTKGIGAIGGIQATVYRASIAG